MAALDAATLKVTFGSTATALRNQKLKDVSWKDECSIVPHQCCLRSPCQINTSWMQILWRSSAGVGVFAAVTHYDEVFARISDVLLLL